MPIGIILSGQKSGVQMHRAQVGFPRLGSFGTFLGPALRTLGLDLVVAPLSLRRTLDLGTRHNPEMTCAPCKLLFGNYVEALEQGCPVLVMLGGPGTCRLGYSARLQETWLRQMRFDFQAYTLDLRHFSRDAIRILRTVTGASWTELIEMVRFALPLIECDPPRAFWLHTGGDGPQCPADPAARMSRSHPVAEL
jgi:hypothetical protein